MATLRTNTHKVQGEKPIISKRTAKKEETKIIDLTVNKEKLTALLNDGRELSIPLEWFAKWGVENITANKLKKYEIWRGKNIHFTEINEVLGIEKFTEGFNASC